MGADIVALPGVSKPDVPAARQPDDQVIMCLEEALDRARRGEIRAVAIAEAGPGDFTNYNWSFAEVGMWHLMTAAIMDLQFEFARSRSEYRHGLRTDPTTSEPA